MDKMLFYPTITPELLEASGFSTDDYCFKYNYQGNTFTLDTKGSSVLKLTDPLDIWNVETEGLVINKTIRFAYPSLLQGASGIACKDATLGICIIWTNKKLTRTGIIHPSTDTTAPSGRVCAFDYTFEPGTISGDLDLSTVFYIKQPATVIQEDETALINESGVTLGEVDHIILDFNSLYMEFPIEEVRSEDEPLWWAEFSEWEDPKTIDMFSKDSFCLFLNPYYDACPAPSVSENSNAIKNFDLLVDILAQTYQMMFQRLSKEDLSATIQGVGLTNGTVCSILHEFVEDCVYADLHWESPEKLLKSLQLNIRQMLQEEE